MTDTPQGLDDRAVDLLVARLVDALRNEIACALREELEVLVAQVVHGRHNDRLLTVEDVARRFNVARSTVYAHWREWGGHKLGAGEKATIRFRPAALPDHPPPSPDNEQPTASPRRHRTRQPILRGRPRMPSDLG